MNKLHYNKKLIFSIILFTILLSTGCTDFFDESIIGTWVLEDEKPYSFKYNKFSFSENKVFLYQTVTNAYYFCTYQMNKTHITIRNINCQKDICFKYVIKGQELLLKGDINKHSPINTYPTGKFYKECEKFEEDFVSVKEIKNHLPLYINNFVVMKGFYDVRSGKKDFYDYKTSMDDYDSYFNGLSIENAEKYMTYGGYYLIHGIIKNDSKLHITCAQPI